MKKFTAMAFVAAALCGCATSSSDDALWAPVPGKISTPWAEQVTPSNVLAEYPRPGMVRTRWQNLNGLWDYAITPATAASADSMQGKILVPFAVESSLSGVGRRITADDALWYSTTFTVPRSWRKDRVMLNFGAVDFEAEVWVNGNKAGSHKGGYTAFSFDITPYLNKGGKQSLVLKVLDATDNDEQPRGKQVSNPRSIWYTPVSGIWQTVWIEPVGEAAIASYTAVPDFDASTVSVGVCLDGALPSDEVRVYLYEGGIGYDSTSPGHGALVAEALAGEDFTTCLKVPEAKAWSPESPYLYALEISLLRGGKEIDHIEGYTAVRKSSEVRDDKGFRRIGLNGKPYFQFGPLDQGWWPDGLYTAPTDEALLFDIVKTKEFGFNMIRKHIKVEPERWYWHCDREGITVWQDMPSLAGHLKGAWGQWGYNTGEDYPLTETAKAEYYKEWGEIIAQFGNHPCIVVWVPFNESWSQFDTEAVVDFTRTQDSTRLINSASGGNSYLCGDILDSHNYPNPKMKFRSEGAQIDVLGEYGGIGFPIEGHLWQPDRNWGYIEYKSVEEVAACYEAYAEELAATVPEGVSAAVYTQTTDVEGEVNGLMTYDRKVIKIPEERLRAANTAVISAL